MESDIVALLQDQYSRYGITSFKQAAKEIERLRRDYSAAEKDHCDYVAKYCNATVEIERLRKERDELRREICGYSFQDARVVADFRGWDCFKEDSHEH